MRLQPGRRRKSDIANVDCRTPHPSGGQSLRAGRVHSQQYAAQADYGRDTIVMKSELTVLDFGTRQFMSKKDAEAKTRVATMAAGLRRRIIAGNLGPGDHMPSVRELARPGGVSAFPAARVYDLLVAEGIVDARRGAGYFVARTAEALKARTPVGREPVADSIWSLRRSYDSRLVRVEAGCGWLPPDWLFADGVRAALAQVARRPSAYPGRYRTPYALPPLPPHLSAP